MQTLERGKHDILPATGAIRDRAGMPVTMPRNSDCKVRRQRQTAASSASQTAWLSAEECTAHPNFIPARPIARARGQASAPRRPIVRMSVGSDRADGRKRR